MTPRDPRWLHRFDVAYDRALRLYPRGFRAQWGDAMRQAFRDRCREAARGERSPLALLAESCADLARSLAAEHSNSMEEAPMKACAIALAAVLCAAHLAQLVLLDADIRFVLASLAMLGPTLLFLLTMARPAWPLRLAALVFNGLMPALFAATLLQGKLPPKGPATFVLALEILEQVENPGRFLKNLRGYGLPVLLSYHATDDTADIDRAALGWRSHLSRSQLQRGLATVGFRVTASWAFDGRQSLLKLRPVPVPARKASAATEDAA